MRVSRPVSIGTRWTLRYTAALLVTVSIFAAYTYSQVVSRTEKDAKLHLELQVNEIADVIRDSWATAPSVIDTVERNISIAESDLKLGIRIFDAKGSVLLKRGSLALQDLELSGELGDGSQKRVWYEVDFGDRYSYLVMEVPVKRGFVQGALYTRRFVRNARAVRDIYLYSLPVLLLLTAGLGSWLARGSLRPIKEINLTARRIKGTHLEETIPTTGNRDELDDLAHTLNEMIASIRASVSRMQRFSANAAHELRTPLNALRSRIDVTLEKERESEEYRRILSEMAEEVESLSDSVHAMMRLARSEAGLQPEQRVPVEISSLLGEVVEFFQPLAVDADVQLLIQPADPVTVPGDPSWLHQLFANLLHNAVKYTPAGGRIEVVIAPEEARVRVMVRDTGVGIDPEQASSVFEPFHRVAARPEASGVGLGLPLAREIARAHGGEIVLESEPGSGSTFTIMLPTVSADS
jgi:two-component system heavy metal sensor histidine kinase CusS